MSDTQHDLSFLVFCLQSRSYDQRAASKSGCAFFQKLEKVCGVVADDVLLRCEIDTKDGRMCVFKTESKR